MMRTYESTVLVDDREEATPSPYAGYGMPQEALDAFMKEDA